MSWEKIKLIFAREVRDQLRDRRTLFMIFVLPLLLYPLLGMSMFQVAQFRRESPTRILVVGYQAPPGAEPLIVNGRFSDALIKDSTQTKLLELVLADSFKAKNVGETTPGVEPAAAAKELLDRGQYEVIIYFPPDFGQRIKQLRDSINQRGARRPPIAKVPAPELYFNSAKEKSQVAQQRVSMILRRWVDKLGNQNIEQAGLSAATVRPFEVDSEDVASPGHRDAAMWSKLFPVVLLLWALTGAFYPAVDLCAGEKERGTLETLLTSPALRSEIVVGKLLTVMMFSIVTSMLNLVSMGITGLFVMRQLDALAGLPRFGLPPMSAPLWLLLALVPMAALFGALCIALASFARSSREGQYYLMPLVLVITPLVILPMAPGVELNLGNSLIPVTGVVLLLRNMLEGNYWEALPFVAPVALVTLSCCYLAVRWAVDQFNDESVLFRESERVNMSIWLRHLVRDREDLPSPAEGVFCGVLILTIQFFMSLAIHPPMSFRDLAVLMVNSQLVVILTPAILMAVMLTRRPAKALLLSWPRWATVPMALLLAFALHPLHNTFIAGLTKLYPLGEQAKLQVEGVTQLLNQAPNGWTLLLVIAVLPAICEELAFRGFILMGLRQSGHRWRAILVSSLLFGLAHPVLQQSIPAVFLGIVLAYIAVQTGSLLPGIIFHVTHNSLATLHEPLAQLALRHPWVNDWVVSVANKDLAWRWPSIIVGTAIGALILWWFARQPHFSTKEEAVQEAIHQKSGEMVSV